MPLYLALFWAITTLVIVGGLIRMFYLHGHRTLIFSIFLAVVMPLSFLVFAFDYRNIYAIGENYTEMVRALPEAGFLYTMYCLVFFATFYLAAEFWKPSAPMSVGVIARGTLIALTSDLAIAGLLLVHLALVGALLAGGVSFGGGLIDALTNGWLRPVANIWSVWSVFVGTLTSARFFLRPGLRTGGEVVLALILSLVTGQRAVALLPFITGFIAVLGSRGSRRIVLASVIGISVIPAALLLSELRASRSTEMATAQVRSNSLSGSEMIAYGNNFSEVRDFAWVLGNYDGRLLGGTTYIAGYTSFIPSAALSFRTDWAFGTFTARTAGLDPRYTGGLRTGFFSEMMFNFGKVFALLGTIVYGVLTGRIFSRQVVISKYSESLEQRTASDLAVYYMFVVYNACIFTPGFFFVMIMIAVMLFLFSIRKLFPPKPVPS